MDRDKQRLVAHVAWAVATQIMMAEPAIDLAAEDAIERCAEVVERLCRKLGVDSYIEDKAPDDDTISDGLNPPISAWCPTCGGKTMQVVRPGKYQCEKCG